MNVHRRQAHRRQAYSGNPFQVTPSATSANGKKPESTTPSSPSTSINSSPTPPKTSSTSSTPPNTSSSSSSTSSSSSSTSIATPTSVTPVVAVPTTSTTSVRTTPRTSLPATSFTRSSTTSLASNPPSTSAGASNSGSTVSTGAIVGGVAAGLLGIAGIIFAVLYFIRRSNKKRDENAFDSDVFRRQSRMLHNEPQLLPDNDGPFFPRPPTMIERRMNSTPVSNMSGNNYGPGPTYGRYNDYVAYNSPGFSPGQVISHHHPYADSRIPPSPMSPPMSPPMSVNNGDIGVEQSQSAYLSRQPPANGPAPSDNAHYVDLSRSSVTPFQAAQYEDIHRRLNMPLPEPVLGAFAEEEYPQREPVPKGPSPFADPSEDLLPPPSPAHSNRSRIDSNPPRLPELNPPMSPVYALHPPPSAIPAPAPAHTTRPNPSAPNQKRPDTVYTIYDDEDAYGGI